MLPAPRQKAPQISPIFISDIGRHRVPSHHPPEIAEADRWICISQNFKDRRARAAHSETTVWSASTSCRWSDQAASLPALGDPLPRRRQFKAPAIGHVIGHFPERNMVDDQGIGSMCVDPS
jgi:hypothetical protein